ncbi:hypothetical protein [Aetokthonos hydrillicola]|uniref:hypothetical protein n=1 Tax=Aetokthonos hydrillicola TaxID=1550245 RepID=UPI0036F198F6
MARILKHRRFLQASVAIALSIGIGFMLHTIKVNADIVHQQDTTQKLVSPAASTTASSIYVNPQIGQDSQVQGRHKRHPIKLLLMLSFKLNQVQLFSSLLVNITKTVANNSRS